MDNYIWYLFYRCQGDTNRLLSNYSPKEKKLEISIRARVLFLGFGRHVTSPRVSHAISGNHGRLKKVLRRKRPRLHVFSCVFSFSRQSHASSLSIGISHLFCKTTGTIIGRISSVTLFSRLQTSFAAGWSMSASSILKNRRSLRLAH